MGKSDPIVFQWYQAQLEKSYKSIAFLGFPGPNVLTNSFQAEHKHYFDLTAGNWDINSPQWNIRQSSYDLVFCTRCAYFAKDAPDFIKRALLLAKKGGTLFVDWGLGDHWHFPMFKVGWLRGAEHESVEYAGRQNRLYSCFWDDFLESVPDVVQFRSHLGRYGYPSTHTIGDIVREEVPSILKPSNIGPARIRSLFLWPETPQLYISTLYIRDPI